VFAYSGEGFPWRVSRRGKVITEKGMGDGLRKTALAQSDYGLSNTDNLNNPKSACRDSAGMLR